VNRRGFLAAAGAAVLGGGMAVNAATQTARTALQGPQQLMMAAAGQAQLAPTSSCAPEAGGQVAAVEGTGAVLAARAAYAAGWRGDDLRTAVMLAGAESGYNPRAGNQLGDGRTHQGLWQISSLHTELMAKYGDRFDPVANARMAHELWTSVRGRWSPTWEAYTNGSYQRYAGQADAALAQLNVDSTSEGALATTGAEPCAPNDAGATGAEVYTGAGVQTVQGRTGLIQVVAVAPSIVVNVRWAPHIIRLLADAKADGIRLGGSGWRSHQRQIELYAQNCGGGRCSPPTAKPGTSEHEDGLAIDWTFNGSLIRSRTSPGYLWLASSGGAVGTARGTTNRYASRNLPSEPWHWSVDGT